MLFSQQFVIYDKRDSVPIASGQPCAYLWVADAPPRKPCLDVSHYVADRVVVNQDAAPAPMELSVSVHNRDGMATPLDGCYRNCSELGPVSLRSCEVSGKSLREGISDGQRNPCSHHALAVTAVDYHIEVAVERKLDEIATNVLHR